MTNSNINTTVSKAKLEAEMNSFVTAFNKAVKKNDLEAKNQAEADLKDRASKYADAARRDFFTEISDVNDYNGTIIRALTQMTYTVKSYTKQVDDSGIETGVALCDKSVEVNLRKLCSHNKFSTSWVYTAEKLNQLLTAYTSIKLDRPDLAKKTMESSYVKQKVKEIEMGKTPTSSTQVCKQLQQVIDAILFVPGDSNPEVNKYRVNKHDVNYLEICYAKRGRVAGTVSVPRSIEKLITDILHRLVVGGKYDVDGKIITG